MTEALATAPPKVFTGKLHRTRRGRRKTFQATPPLPPRQPVRRPARIAVMLALAHKIQDAIDRCVVRDRAAVARRLGITRARVTQLLDLTLLAPDLQEAIFDLESIDGVEPLCERRIRVVGRTGTWELQRQHWTNMVRCG